MQKISAVIITFNEERNIERCITSLKAIADEIIIIDSFSSDRTSDMCKEMGVKFIQRKWEGYSTAKNFGNSLAENDYILSIDADEALSDELCKSLNYFRITENVLDSYSFNRCTNYCGKWIRHGDWYPDIKLRLWNKNKGQWVGEIHEEVVMQAASTNGFLKGDLLHYSYYSLEQHLTQANKFTDLTAKAAYDKGKKASFLKIFLNPYFKFFKDYILKFGFLDGYQGFVVCKISAYATLLKYAKLREMYKLKQQDTKEVK
jgi:glycosyltransferase involved in cell wall biosynthesis